MEYGFRSENSDTEDFGGRKCRFACIGGGWFSYNVAVDPNESVALIATFWGGVWHERKFDIFIDGQNIGSQRLHVNKPGEFFDKTYVIPRELTRGKTKITLRFVAQPFEENPDDIASGLFGLRTMLESAAHG